LNAYFLLSCTYFTMNTTDAELPYAVVFGTIMSIGFPLNAIAIWILLRHHSLKSPNVIFMLNLAIADLLLACSLPLKVYFYATGVWPLGYTACIGVRVLFHVNICTSSIFITFISVDRVLAVVYPLRSLHIRTARNAVKAVILAWLLLIIIAILRCIEFGEHLKHYNKYSCFEYRLYADNPRSDPVKIFQLILVLVLLVVNVVSTVLVFLTLRRNVKDLPKVNNRVNVMLLFVMSLIMFIICFLPKTIGSFIKGHDTMYLKCICIAATNCCLDPVLYYFSLDAFWKKKEESKPAQTRAMIRHQRH
uniref:Lysophosphatidic acid receptor 5b n=1 Tax=Neogobius melanostomus TaxID=47308 RepID=A0A8C6UQK9_9GOBI